MREKLSSPKKILIISCFTMFVLYAIHFNGFGTNAQNIMAYFGVSESGNGLIMTTQAVGCIAVTVLLGLYGERINKIYGILLGLFVMGAADIAIGAIPALTQPGAGYGLMLSLSLVAGVGYITIDLLMNGVVADVFPERKNTLLPIVHAFYGGGAMLAPIFVTKLIDPVMPASFSKPYLIIGLVSVAVSAAVLIAALRVTPETPYADKLALKNAAKQKPMEVFKSRKAWLFLLACFFYLCFQTGISTWLPKYCAEHLSLDYAAAGLMVTLYFLGALIMRLLSPLVYKKLSVKSFYIAGLLASMLVFLAFLLLPLPLPARQALMLLMGLLQGASVPALVILCCDAFPTRTASASSIVVMGVSIAALTAPVLLGKLIESGGYLTAMLIMTACIPASVIVLGLIKERD